MSSQEEEWQECGSFFLPGTRHGQAKGTCGSVVWGESWKVRQGQVVERLCCQAEQINLSFVWQGWEPVVCVQAPEGCFVGCRELFWASKKPRSQTTANRVSGRTSQLGPGLQLKIQTVLSLVIDPSLGAMLLAVTPSDLWGMWQLTKSSVVLLFPPSFFLFSFLMRNHSVDKIPNISAYLSLSKL